MGVTIYDVAKIAGVGLGTVSRVLNNSDHISPETRKKVLDAIEKLNYKPHAFARGLAKQKTNILSIIVPFFTGYFYIELLKGIQKSVTKFEYDLVLYNVEKNNRLNSVLDKVLNSKLVDGVILISMSLSDKYAIEFNKQNLPIVLVDSYHPGVDSFFIENKKGAYIATKHLIDLGHKRVGMIDAQLKSTPAKIRLEGYKAALKDRGITFDSKYLVISDSDEKSDGFSREAGYSAMKRLLMLGEDRPTAVFISSDIQAVGAMKAIREEKLTIPDDIAIIGFDDIEFSEAIGLSTMRQPMFEMGEMAVDILLKRISGQISSLFHKKYIPELIIRETC